LQFHRGRILPVTGARLYEIGSATFSICKRFCNQDKITAHCLPIFPYEVLTNQNNGFIAYLEVILFGIEIDIMGTGWTRSWIHGDGAVMELNVTETGR